MMNILEIIFASCNLVIAIIAVLIAYVINLNKFLVKNEKSLQEIIEKHNPKRNTK